MAPTDRKRFWPHFRRPRWWLLSLVAVLALGAWGIWGRRPPPPPAPKAAAASATPARMERLCLTEVQDGDKRWVLDAEKADFHKARDEVGVSVVRVEFFGPGQHIIVRGQEGWLNTKTRILTLKGQVEIESGDLHLKTSIINYLPAERVLLAPEDVIMENPRLRVEGKGLRVEMTGKKMFLTQHRLTQVKTQGWNTTP